MTPSISPLPTASNTPPISVAFSSETPDALAIPVANCLGSGIVGLTSSAFAGASSFTSTLPPNNPFTKSFMPVKILDMVSVIGWKKPLIESNKDFKVSSPNSPKVTKFNMPPKPETMASPKLPVS